MAELLARVPLPVSEGWRIEKMSAVECGDQLADFLGRDDLAEAMAERGLQIEYRVGPVEQRHQKIRAHP